VTTTWNALYDKLIVRRAPAVTHLAGMEIPEQAREKQNVGTIVKVGAGRIVNGSFGTLQKLLVEEGDEVLFSKHSGYPLEGDDPDLVVLREDEILAYRKAGV
jgi:co-chaperonin GroES (HSP10)